MWLTNKLTTENGAVSFLPTSLGYHRKITKQAEKMAAQKKAWEAQQAKIREGKRNLKNLELETWWDECSPEEQKQAQLICVQVGYYEAKRYIKETGMHGRHKSRNRLTGISYY
jgi:leucyl aminopeptidase